MRENVFVIEGRDMERLRQMPKDTPEGFTVDPVGGLLYEQTKHGSDVCDVSLLYAGQVSLLMYFFKHQYTTVFSHRKKEVRERVIIRLTHLCLIFEK